MDGGVGADRLYWGGLVVERGGRGGAAVAEVEAVLEERRGGQALRVDRARDGGAADGLGRRRPAGHDRWRRGRRRGWRRGRLVACCR